MKGFSLAAALAFGFVLVAAGCGSGDDTGSGGAGASSKATGGGGTTGEAGTSSLGGGGGSSDGGSGGVSSGGGGHGGAALPECGDRATKANSWIAHEFASAPVLTGDFTQRSFVELPRLIKDATATNAKYGFDLRDEEDPKDPRVALVNVKIHDLKSTDAFGGSFETGGAPGAHVFLSNVYLEPNWPGWVDYATTNYDGMTLDGSEEIFGEDVTVKNWNADTAADVKSQRAQFVCLTTEGDGNRTLRLWHVGPHYLVKSSVNNAAGAIIWMETCTGATINVYDSTFNGEPKIPANKISCDDGGTPDIVYLTTDPRTTGEMHPMFSAP